MSCPNCQQTVADGKMICPHCGAFITPPPTPERFTTPLGAFVSPPGWPEERLLTGRRGLDFWIGFLPPPTLAVLFAMGYELGNEWITVVTGALFLAAMVLCAMLPGRYPVVARGLGWGLAAIPIGMVLFVLGAFAVCLYSVFNPARHL